MHASKMTVEGRETIRSVSEGKGVPKGYEQVAEDLERAGYISPPRLTAKGKQALAEILDSGDGPEALKEMLRF